MENRKFKAFFDEIGFTPDARRATIGAIVAVVEQYTEACFTIPSYSRRNTEMVFSNSDIKTHMLHNLPIYLHVKVNAINIDRV